MKCDDLIREENHKTQLKKKLGSHCTIRKLKILSKSAKRRYWFRYGFDDELKTLSKTNMDIKFYFLKSRRGSDLNDAIFLE